MHAFFKKCSLLLASLATFSAFAETPPPDNSLDPDLLSAISFAAKTFLPENQNEDISESILKGIFGNLDRYSALLTPQEAEQEAGSIAGKAIGFGIQGMARKDGIFVEYVVENSPAGKAGIRYADLIRSANGISCEELGGAAFQPYLQNLSRQCEKPTELVVQSPNAAPRNVTLVPAPYRLPSVRGAQILPGTAIGYVRLSSFTLQTANECKDALALLRQHPLDALILDLRNNSGGDISFAIEVADLFLPQDTTIAWIRKRNERKRILAKSPDGYPELRLALLIDSQTASAAELLAAALHENNRASLFGTKTFGKTSIQGYFAIPSRQSYTARLTVGYWSTPQDSLVRNGISPDYVIEQPPEKTPACQNILSAQPSLPEHSPFKLPATIPDLRPDLQLDAAFQFLKKTDPAKTPAAPLSDL